MVLQFCASNFLSESALEAIEAGRAEFAATLMDMGLLPPSFRQCMQQQARSSPVLADTQLHEFDSYCNNGRIVKAALCAGELVHFQLGSLLCQTSCQRLTAVLQQQITPLLMPGSPCLFCHGCIVGDPCHKMPFGKLAAAACQQLSLSLPKF